MPEQRAPPQIAHDNCQNCYFSDVDAGGFLHCRRDTPTTDASLGSWPIVQPTDWCAYGYYNNAYYTPDGNRP
jgi:hypothetical protein